MGISLTLAADQHYTSHVYVDYSVGLNVIHTNKSLGRKHHETMLVSSVALT